MIGFTDLGLSSKLELLMLIIDTARGLAVSITPKHVPVPFAPSCLSVDGFPAKSDKFKDLWLASLASNLAWDWSCPTLSLPSVLDTDESSDSRFLTNLRMGGVGLSTVSPSTTFGSSAVEDKSSNLWLIRPPRDILFALSPGRRPLSWNESECLAVGSGWECPLARPETTSLKRQTAPAHNSPARRIGDHFISRPHHQGAKSLDRL
mmetsp:Transcript_28631/g.64616  ORF Transcript_28631/g.64616 Transcript_28631/m.64616 type:complete len:206 (+) Transcript_28631:446-1063(+)